MRRVQQAWQSVRLVPRDQTILAWLTGLGFTCLLLCYVLPGDPATSCVRWDRLGPRQAAFQLDMNAADSSEWRLLPGIGPSLAQRIIDSRRREGPFRGPEDLRRVRGIGPKTLDRIRPYLLTAKAENIDGRLLYRKRTM